MTDQSSIDTMQERAYEREDVYRSSPHLRHAQTYQFLLRSLRDVMADIQSRSLPTTLIEVGAGAGGFVEPALAYGWQVTATDMARPAMAFLEAQYGHNAAFTPVLDLDGTLSVLGDQRFSIALYASVLHHIPDYESAIATTLRHLEPGGAFISFQDPLWYPTQPRGVRLFSEAAYLGWRLAHRGNYIAGVRARLRRAAGRHNAAEPADMVEFHVVRSGVNQHRLEEAFSSHFERFSVVPYWSTQGTLGQAAGERLSIANNFAILATGYCGASD
jgi:SAM-dependent methyltransferase